MVYNCSLFHAAQFSQLWCPEVQRNVKSFSWLGILWLFKGNFNWQFLFCFNYGILWSMQFSVAWPESETLENLCLWDYSYQLVHFGSYFLEVCLLCSAVSLTNWLLWKCMIKLYAYSEFWKGNPFVHFDSWMLSLIKHSYLFVSVFSTFTLCEDIQW